MDKWLEYRIYANHEDEDHIIRTFIEPLVSLCDEQDGLRARALLQTRLRARTNFNLFVDHVFPN